jgi:3',5'-cyclic AMP phosphodiesterase CpdA
VIRIVHASDLHYDGSRQLREALEQMVSMVVDRDPDLVAVTGDLTADGTPRQLDDVREAFVRFGGLPLLIVPGNRDLDASSGPPGEAEALPDDSDLDFFLALEPALALGLEDGDTDVGDATDRFVARFGPSEPVMEDDRFVAVGVNSTPKLSSESLARAARRLRRAGRRHQIVAMHHGLLPVPGRKLRDGDLVARAGDVLSLLCDLGVDLVLHGHVHRANVWRLADVRGDVVVASAGALVNDGRRDASFLAIALDDATLEIDRVSVATGRTTRLYETDDRRAGRQRKQPVATR